MKKNALNNLDNPVGKGFQTFKKGFGFFLIVVSLIMAFQLLSFAVDLAEKGYNSGLRDIISNYLPEDSKFRTISFELPDSNSDEVITSKIVVPESFYLFGLLILLLILVGIIIKFLTAVFRGGISLMQEDITYVLRILRNELRYAEKTGKISEPVNNDNSVNAKKDFQL